MEPEAIRPIAILSAAGQVTAAALALAGRRRSAAVVTAVVAGGFLLLAAVVATRVPAPGEIAMLAGEALGLLTLVVIAFRPNRPWFWLWFCLAWILIAVGTTMLVSLAFFFRMWK
jgi:hypothetical protein